MQIDHLFGIISCDAHRHWAMRDCNAYMHSKGIVRLRDAQNIHGLSEVIAEIIDKNGTFHVTRTSGAIETGWKVVEDAFEYPSLEKFDGTWRIYLTNTKLRKFVPLDEFRKSSVFSPSFAELTTVAIDILNRGVYLTDYERQCRLAAEASNISEEQFIQTAIMPNGTVVRMLVP